VRYRIRVLKPENAGKAAEPDRELMVIRWMTVKQISIYLQISVAKVYQMAQDNEIPCCRLGQQWRFEREEIDRWLRRLR
jgi:excisionase family DNA binding protein